MPSLTNYETLNSAEAHERKPNLGFYQHVIAETGLNPATTAFVDDKLENVLTARSVGIHGIVFDDVHSVVRQLRNLYEDPVSRAWSFLSAKKKQLKTVSSGGVVVSEVINRLVYYLKAFNHIFLSVIELLSTANSRGYRRRESC